MKSTKPLTIEHQKEICASRFLRRCATIVFTVLALSAGIGLTSAGAATAQNLFAVTKYGEIFKYTPNGTKSTFASGLSRPFGLASDSAGDMYVTIWNNGYTGSGSIYKFTPDGTQTTFYAPGGLLTEPACMAFDSAGDLFVSDYGDGIIYKFAGGAPGTPSQFATGLYNPTGLAFDSTGNLFVGTANGYIYKYTPSGAKSTFASVRNQSENGTSWRLAFDSADNLYAADNANDSIYEFKPDGTQSTFKSGLNLPVGLGFDSAGDLFEADMGSETINEFANVGGTLQHSSTVFASGLANLSDLAIQTPGTWTQSGSMNDGRWDHTATLLPDGQVLVAGGVGLYVNELSSAELYNPDTMAWTRTGSLETGRYLHAATLLPDGRVLIAGGYNYDMSTTLSSCELYDPSTGTWTPTGSMNVARLGQTMTLLNDGQVLVTGGQTAFGTGKAISSCELYNPATGQWTYTGSMNINRSEQTATLLPNGQVLVAGGFNGASYVSSAELYNPNTGQWTYTGSMNSVRSDHTATLLNNGEVLVAGGGGELSSAELFNPATGQWTYTGSMNAGRQYDTATLLPDGQVVVAGGEATDSSDIDTVSAELYNPATGIWTYTGSMNYERGLFTATVLNNGQVIVAGGGIGVYDATSELYY